MLGRLSTTSGIDTHITSMLPLPERGNASQTLCHRPFPSTILPRYLFFAKTLKSKKSCFIWKFQIISLYLHANITKKKDYGNYRINYHWLSGGLLCKQADERRRLWLHHESCAWPFRWCPWWLAVLTAWHRVGRHSWSAWYCHRRCRRHPLDCFAH